MFAAGGFAKLSAKTRNRAGLYSSYEDFDLVLGAKDKERNLIKQLQSAMNKVNKTKSCASRNMKYKRKIYICPININIKTDVQFIDSIHRIHCSLELCKS